MLGTAVAEEFDGTSGLSRYGRLSIGVEAVTGTRGMELDVS